MSGRRNKRKSCPPQKIQQQTREEGELISATFNDDDSSGFGTSDFMESSESPNTASTLACLDEPSFEFMNGDVNGNTDPLLEGKDLKKQIESTNDNVGLLAHVKRLVNQGDPRTVACTLCSKRLLGEHALRMHMHLAHGHPRPWKLLLPGVEKCASQADEYPAMHSMLSRYQSGDSPDSTVFDEMKRVHSSASLSSPESHSDQDQPLDLSISSSNPESSPVKPVPMAIHPAFSGPLDLSSEAMTAALVNVCACTVCGARFATLDARTEHMRQCHTVAEEKRFPCEVCNLKFKRRDHLNIHMQRHTGIVPHRCEVCQRGFGTVYKLNRHMRSHTKEKPYQCEICLKRFPYDNTYKRHLRLHSGEKGHRCTICSQAFYRPDALKVHLEKKHGVIQTSSRQQARARAAEAAAAAAAAAVAAAATPPLSMAPAFASG